MKKVYRITTVFGRVLVVANNYEEAEKIFKNHDSDSRYVEITSIEVLPESLIDQA